MAGEDTLLIERCLAGDAEALMALERMLRDPAARLRSMGMQEAQIEDVTADVRARLLLPDGDRPPALRRFAGTGSLAGYIRAMVVRLGIDRMRATRPTTSLDEVDQVAAFATSLESELTKLTHASAVNAAFRQAWNHLPTHQRLLLSQQVIDQLSVDEIGALHGVHRATAARRCVAAREALLARLRHALRDALGADTATAESILFTVASRLSGVLQAPGPHDPHHPHDP